jgi:hypothetical protein
MAVYYWCPDDDRPYGGVRAIYRHVDILNANGVPAFVLHERSPFRCSWFANNTPVAYRALGPRLPMPATAARTLRRARRTIGLEPEATIRLGSEDVLAVPETMAFSEMEFASGVPKVIFNQGAYVTFRNWPPEIDFEHSPYGSPDVLAVLTTSVDGQRYLRVAFPELRVLRARYSVDPTLFHGESEKESLVAFMPRKNRDSSKQVLLQLDLRGALAGWEVVAIDRMSETEVAEVLNRSSVFLSFGHPEGFGLPPLEAMRCGCIVIGYHGMGGREYFRPPRALPIPFGDITLYVETVERVLGAFQRDPEPLLVRAREAARFVADEYSPEREVDEVLRAWREILGWRR